MNAGTEPTTVAPLEVMLSNGIGYLLPATLFGGYGLVRIAEAIEAGRVLLQLQGGFLRGNSDEPQEGGV